MTVHCHDRENITSNQFALEEIASVSLNVDADFNTRASDTFRAIKGDLTLFLGIQVFIFVILFKISI